MHNITIKSKKQHNKTNLVENSNTHNKTKRRIFSKNNNNNLINNKQNITKPRSNGHNKTKRQSKQYI